MTESCLCVGREKMEKRGEILYRQPDGTLGVQRPPRNPYTVAARRQWADLVRYARVTGGDEEASNGKSYRYNLGVRYDEHVAFLKSINQEPELDADGSWLGYDAKYELPRPEDHPWTAMLEKLKTTEFRSF